MCVEHLELFNKHVERCLPIFAIISFYSNVPNQEIWLIELLSLFSSPLWQTENESCGIIAVYEFSSWGVLFLISQPSLKNLAVHECRYHLMRDGLDKIWIQL